MVIWFKSLILASLGIALASCTTVNTTAAPARPEATIAQKPDAAPRQNPIVEGLERPWSMAWLPDGAMLVTEKAGRLRIVQNDQLVSEPIAGVPEVLTEGQAGLMEVSLHPRFAENQLIYLTYSHGTIDANRTRLAALLGSW
jgi:aldose sugar dehydrogenase